MIEKLIAIKNVGKVSSLVIHGANWDGVLSKNAIIYAPNGSGKTTVSMIFQSLGGDPAILIKKKTFQNLRHGGCDEQSIRLKINGRLTEFKNGNWAGEIPLVEVFNVHFVEDNLFSGSIQPRPSQVRLFDILVGDAGVALKNELKLLLQEKERLTRERQILKRGAKRGKVSKEARISGGAEIDVRVAPINTAINEKRGQLGLLSQATFDSFVVRCNHYLGKFSGALQIEKISKDQDQRTTLYLMFGEASSRITFSPTQNGHEFKYSLSEGDKNALAISMFLAKLDMQADIDKKCVVFDDPLTSLDSGRRRLTITELAKLSARAGQTIVLTHDASFAADLERAIHGPTLSLELVSSAGETYFRKRDHQQENATGLARDIAKLMKFRQEGSTDESDRRDVVRCIRPILEGIIRIKYFDYLGPTQWLGDFIEMIRSSTSDAYLARLKIPEIYESLVELNDYSKGMHHSSPSEPTIPVDEVELMAMAKRTLDLVKML